MTADIIKKALSLAEKEAQEKEIQKIKGIVQSYLERIDTKVKAKKELEDEIKILKSDLDDLKAGRLDKIEERQKKDEKARNISIIVVKRIEKEYIPYRPWYSPWVIEYNPFFDGTITVTQSSPAYYDSISSGMFSGTADATSFIATGVQCSSFTGGTYTIHGHSVIL